MAKYFLKTTPEIKQHIAVNISSEASTIRAYIDMASEKFLIPYLGQEQYSELLDAYWTDAIVADSAQDKLLKYVHRALANFAYMLYIPVGQVQISDEGVHISVTENKKAAFEHQIVKLERAFLNHGWDAIEMMLDFLEANTGIFTTWVGSAAYTEFKESYIYNAKMFSLYFNIAKSRRLFVQFKAAMMRIEQTYILPIICTELDAEIRGQITDGEDAVSAENKKLLVFIRPAIAHLTIAEVANEIGLTINEYGIVTLGSTNSSGTVTQEKAAGDNRIDALVRSCKSTGELFLAQLRQFLTDNEYPLHRNSTCYSADFNKDFENNAENTIYSV